MCVFVFVCLRACVCVTEAELNRRASVEMPQRHHNVFRTREFCTYCVLFVIPSGGPWLGRRLLDSDDGRRRRRPSPGPPLGALRALLTPPSPLISTTSSSARSSSSSRAVQSVPTGWRRVSPPEKWKIVPTASGEDGCGERLFTESDRVELSNT